jgi:hypothetical protein
MEKQKKQQRKTTIRIAITNIVMACTVLVVSAGLLLVSMGYKIGADGSLDRTGMIQINSLPTGAYVQVDGKVLSDRTDLSKTFDSGMHEVVVYLDGYVSWYKNVAVNPGRITRMNYVRLFPKNPTSEDVTSYKTAVYQRSMDLGRQTIIVMKTMAEWDVIDIRASQPKTTPINIEPAFSKIDIVEAQAIEIVDWSDDGQRVLIKMTSADGGAQWAVTDLNHPEQSINLERAFVRQITDAKFSDGGGSNVAIVEAGNLYVVNSGSKTSTALLARNVLYTYADRGIVGYVRGNEWGERVVGLWRDGLNQEMVVATLPEDEVLDKQVMLAFGKFENNGWLVYTVGDKARLFEGEIDRIGQNEKLELVQEKSFGGEFKAMVPSRTKHFVMVEVGESVGVIDMNDLMDYFPIGSAEYNWHWLDDYMLQYNDGTETVVMDYDGGNRFSILPDVATELVISNDNQWMYRFERHDEKLVLVRQRMTV